MTDDSSRDSVINRRRFIQVAGATGTVGLAGCSGNGGGDGGSGGDGDSGGDGGETTTGGTTGTTGDSSADKVVIGSNHPLSGGLSYAGSGMDSAIKLRAQRQNEAGGIESMGGAEVEVISGDNQAKQELGGQVEQELIDEGADVLTGCYVSPVTRAAVQTAERSQVPHVISVAASDDILQGAGLNYAYRPQPPAKVHARDWADLVPSAISEAGGTLETVGLFYVDNSYGQAISSHLENFLPEQDVEVVESVAIESGASSANTQVSRLRSADPDAIIATTYVPGGVTLANALSNQEYMPEYLCGCACATWGDAAAIEDIGGDVTNGIINNNYDFDPNDEDAPEIREQFQSEFDKPMTTDMGMAYIAADVIIAAIEEAGSADPEEINQALKSIELEDHIGAMPPITFQDNGENANALSPAKQIQDLEPKIFSPEEFSATSLQL
jgi:branched-chain amino acid transport system substrate-binding protein